MFRELARARAGMRQRDLAESKHLLWELVTHEPTVLQCFNIIESTCLAQGLLCQIDGERCSDEFQRFLGQHYLPFCRQAVRAVFTYGFVPWRVRRLASGDRVPEVLCNGTFHWYTEIPSREARAVKQQRDSGLVSYRVQITTPLEIKDADVLIFVHTPPALDVSVNSILYATVPSPLSHVLTDYKNLRQAQIRRSHADAWNTTAKLICSFKPSVRVQEEPGAALMDFADDAYYQPGMHLGMPAFAPLGATNLWSRDAQIRKQFEDVGPHHPDIFTLPRDHDVVQQSMLTPCEDLDFLLGKFQRDVCGVMGVPEEMVRSQSRGHETVRKTLASGRIFSANMNDLCRQLQELLCQVYEEIYGTTNVRFTLLPMPRLEIETIEDMRVLFDIGALTPDMSLQLSQILLGEDIDNKRRRQHILGKRAGDDGGLLQPGDLEALKRRPGAGGADKEGGANKAGGANRAGGADRAGAKDKGTDKGQGAGNKGKQARA